MAEELKHVPLLLARIQQINQLQQSRQALFRERQNMAQKTDRPSERTLKDFHGVLSRDDEISSRIQELQAQFAADAPEMLKQIAARRTELQAELEAAKDNPAQFDADELKNKTRAIKIYDYIESRLEALRDDPKQADWMRRVMRGMWMMDELDARTSEQLRRRIDDVQHEQDELRRRMTQLDSQVKELRELLNTVSPPSVRQDTPKNK